MKKVIFSLVLVYLIAGFSALSGIAAWASGGGAPQNTINVQYQGLKAPGCCQLKHKIRVAYGGGYTTIFPGAWVGMPVNDDSKKQMLCPDSSMGSVYGEWPEWAGLCTLDGIMTFSEWIMWIALVITGLALIIAGIMFMAAAGSSEQVTKAKKIFYWSLIGILIAVGAKLIPGIIRYFIGV